MNKERRNTLTLAALLVVFLIVLLILAVLVVKAATATPSSGGDGDQYMELPITQNMHLSEAKAKLDELKIPYEIIPTDSKLPNRIERIEYTGKVENGKELMKVGTSVKIHSNEVGIDKIIYLTFDDGPTRDNTQEIVGTLDAHGIKASFFVEGADVERYPDRMETIFNRGHVIGCHSFSHVFEDVYASIDAFIDEMEQYEAALREALGDERYAKVEKLIRFPGGTNNAYISDAEARQYIAAVRELGYRVYDWTALTGDAEGNQDAQSFIEDMDSGLSLAKQNKLPLIVLMHDKWSTNEALDEILGHLIAQGYYFDTIDNCPEYTFVK